MAVKPAVPRLASHFWPIFIKRKTILVLSLQLAILAIVVAVIYATGQFGSITIWLVVALIMALQLMASVLILSSLTKPTRDLMAAVINVSGEKSSLQLPNPNNTDFERTGFRDALTTIFELATKKDEASNNKNSDTDGIVSSALNLAKCGFIALDKNHEIIYCNKVAPVRSDTDGKKQIDLLFNENDDLKKWLKSCRETAVHADHVWMRVPDRLPNEEGRRFFDVFASYEKGSDVEVALTLVDRTKLYIVDEEGLDFISFAAHELRGPITVIRGYLDVLSDELADKFEDDQQELFHRLIVSANRLSGYIDNILNTSRYDRRHLKMNLSEESLANIYDSISDDMSLRAGAQNRMLSVDIPSDLPTIAADKASISEVLGNLIDNAIKYSNEGGVINVKAKLSGNFVDIAIEDHGIGMPDNVLSNLFQKFYRSHRSREAVAGTGIGLYISKAIVESHGGTISVRSEDGRGSTFIVSLPTYASVEDKLKASNNSNEGLISEGNGWIKNHSMIRG